MVSTQNLQKVKDLEKYNNIKISIEDKAPTYDFPVDITCAIVIFTPDKVSIRYHQDHVIAFGDCMHVKNQLVF